MPTQVSCPSCGLTLRIKDELLGKRVKCPQCSKTFAADEEGAEPPLKSSVRNSKAPPRETDDEDQRVSVVPHRGTMVLVLGICSLGGIVIVPLAFAGVACGII